MTHGFDSRTSSKVLESLARSPQPARFRVVLDGAIVPLTKRVLVRVASGRLIEARAGTADGSEALARILLADSGSIEVVEDETPPGPLGVYPRFDAELAKAQVAAATLSEQLAPLGGFGGMPIADATGWPPNAPVMPEPVRAVANLADGRRTVAEILQAAPFPPELTGRILARLTSMGMVRPTGSRPPIDDPLLPAGRAIVATSHWEQPEAAWGQTSELPSEDEIEGAEIAEDLRGWLGSEPAPSPLLSDREFEATFATAPIVDGVPPAPLAPLTPAAPGPPPDEDEVPPVPFAVQTPAALGQSSDEAPTPLPELSLRDDAASRVRRSVPLTTRRPEPASVEPEEEVLRDAGVSSRGVATTVAIVLLGLLLVALIFVVARQRGGGTLAADAGQARVVALPPPVATTTTATTALQALEPPADAQRAAIAGPDAPEDVRRAEALLDAARYGAAEKLLATLRETRPDDAAVFILSGQVYVDTGRLVAADAMADRALEIDGRSYRAWVLKGSVAQFRSRTEVALQAYQKALELGPNHPMSPEIQSVLDQLSRRAR